MKVIHQYQFKSGPYTVDVTWHRCPYSGLVAGLAKLEAKKALNQTSDLSPSTSLVPDSLAHAQDTK